MFRSSIRSENCEAKVATTGSRQTVIAIVAARCACKCASSVRARATRTIVAARGITSTYSDSSATCHQR
jgi:hypothetical protein